MRAKNGRI